jgi:phenylalanyl-tRNA synthetase beta chain
VPSALNASLSFSEKPDKERVQEKISEMLSNRGFSEMMALSLTREEYSSLVPALDPAQDVRMLNPLSSDLAVLRQTMLFSGLEALAYNINRKSSDLKLFEFGKTYQKIAGEQTKYVETPHLSLFMTGRKLNESWNAPNDNVGFYTLKGVVSAIFERMGITVKESPNDSAMFSQSISLSWNKRVIAELGSVSKSLLKAADLRQEVFYADIRWAVCIDALRQQKPLMYTEVPKFPEVRRDLALLIDQEVKFEQLEQLAYQTEKNLLKSVRLFDVYEGDKLPKGKKSYALSFTLQDLGATLTDKQIDKIMEKLIKTYQEKAGAEIR